MPCFGDFVKAPAQRGHSDVIGLVYDIVIRDDNFVRQMAAAPDLDEAYILDQRQNRQVPIEVSVLAVGYRNGENFYQALPPQPPIALDCILPCAPAEVTAFTDRLDFLRLVLADPTLPGDELIAAALARAVALRQPADRSFFLKQAGKELARLLGRDLARLETLLKRIRPA
jgi:hypothetical protein